MDQGPLVRNEIDEGEKLARAFAAHYKPLQAAFWLKECDDKEWFLCLASNQIDDSNITEAYREVIRILGPGPHTWLDSFQVKVMGVDHPVARDVVEIQRNFPAQLPKRLRSGRLGGRMVDDAFIYDLSKTEANGQAVEVTQKA